MKQEMEKENEKEIFGYADGSGNDDFYGGLWKQ
jgi:hypothetical protein